MGNCLFLLARGWGIDRQVRKKLQIPGGVPGGGMVTGRIEPCINIQSRSLKFAYVRLLFIYRLRTVRGSLSGVWEFRI